MLPFVAPPATLPAFGVLARLPYLAALRVWTLLLGLAAAALTASAAVLTRRSGTPVPAARVVALVALAAGSAPILSAFALGQAALVAAGAITLAALLAGRSRAGTAAAMLAAAVQPNLMPVLVALVRSRQAFGAACAAAFVFLAAATAAVGPPGLVRYAQRLAAHASAERDVTIQCTPAAVLHAFGVPSGAAATAGWIVAGAALALTVVAIRRARLDTTDGLLLACAALPFAVPFFHEHDFALTALPLFVLALRARDRARTLAGFAAVGVLVDWLGLAARPGAAGQIAALGIAAALAFAALDPIPRPRRDWSAPLAAVLLLAVLVPLGLAHPAPTWPDALPSGFHAAPGVDVSQAWSEQNDAAGLRAQDPVWGLLRAVPLAGCALLFAALLTDARDRRRRRASDQMSTFIMSSNEVTACGFQPVRSEL